MDFECHDDCNVVAKKTAAKEHVIIRMDTVFGPCESSCCIRTVILMCYSG